MHTSKILGYTQFKSSWFSWRLGTKERTLQFIVLAPPLVLFCLRYYLQLDLNERKWRKKYFGNKKIQLKQLGLFCCVAKNGCRAAAQQSARHWDWCSKIKLPGPNFDLDKPHLTRDCWAAVQKASGQIQITKVAHSSPLEISLLTVLL